MLVGDLADVRNRRLPRLGGANQAPSGSPIPTQSPVISASNNGVHPSTLSVASTATWTNSPTSKSYQWMKGSSAYGVATSAPQSTETDGAGTYKLTETATNASGSNFSNSNSISITAAVTTVPAKMASPTLTPGDGQITVARAAAPSDGGSAITSYDLRYGTDGANWTTVANIGASQIVPDLTNGTAYQVQTRANNAVGSGPYSDSATATPVGAQATVFRDDFNRADGPITDNPDWKNVSGNTAALMVSNNQLATLAAEGGFQYRDVTSANHYVQALIKGGGAVGPFLVCRLTDQNNWGAAIRFNVSTGAIQLWKRTGGTLTQYGNSTTSNATVGATVRVETVGDQTQIVVNGVVNSLVYPMDGAGAATRTPGIVARTNTNNPWIDDWESGVLSALTA